jgi:hypothetical protein
MREQGRTGLATELATGRRSHTIHARDLIIAIDLALADLEGLRITVTDAMIRAHRDADDGLAGANTSPAVSGTRDPDERMIDRIDRGDDPIRATTEAMIAAIYRARDAAQLAYSEGRKLLPITRERAAFLVRELEGGPSSCCNCGRTVWRTANDRLRAGRCAACYQYWCRHDKKADRPPELWEEAS